MCVCSYNAWIVLSYYSCMYYSAVSMIYDNYYDVVVCYAKHKGSENEIVECVSPVMAMVLLVLLIISMYKYN